MLLKSYIKYAEGKLSPVYGDREASAIVRALCGSVLGVPGWICATEPEFEVSDADAARLEHCLLRLSGCEPLQYVLGKTEFCGLEFHVDSSVLIPRPETELLCRTLLEETVPAMGLKSPKILDLCTGSGCIAWTLAHYIPDSEVAGADLSAEALETASSQNIPGNAPEFLLMDVLSPQDNVRAALGGRCFDIIVSNPPYVRNAEKALMHRNVLDYEPEMALFVPDEDPLLFYRAIAAIAAEHLAAGGHGAVEINEAFGEEVRRLFLDSGFGDARVQTDMSGRDRYVFF